MKPLVKYVGPAEHSWVHGDVKVTVVNHPRFRPYSTIHTTPVLNRDEAGRIETWNTVYILAEDLEPPEVLIEEVELVA
jgi:hypothetical protein